MICDICGRPGAVDRFVTRSFGKGSDLLVIENIPYVSCPNCGERYYTAQTLRQVERIKQHRRAVARKRTVSVAPFRAAVA